MTKVKIAGTAIAAMFLMSSAANAADLYTPEPILIILLEPDPTTPDQHLVIRM
jgi:hypothetical protein